MEGSDPDLVKELSAGDIIVTSTNFGCGSSREHAAIALKSIGAGAVIVDTFGRIFYRNAINLGLPLIVCKGLSRLVNKGDVVQVDVDTGAVTNLTTGATAQAEPISGYTKTILNSGSIKQLIRDQLAQR